MERPKTPDVEHSRASDPLSDADRQMDKRRAAAFWAVSSLLYLVLAVAHPPIEALGPTAGLLITGACMLGTVTYVMHLQAAGASASDLSIFIGALAGAVSIGVAQWLAGGSESPQQLLFALTVFGCASVLQRRHLALYLVTVSAITVAPLLMTGPSQTSRA